MDQAALCIRVGIGCQAIDQPSLQDSVLLDEEAENIAAVGFELR